MSVDSEAWEAQSGLVAGLIFNSLESLLCLLVEACLALELRPLSRPAEHKVVGTGSQLCASGSLGVRVSGPTPISTPWFQDLWILAMAERAPYAGWGIRVHTASWRTSPQPCKVLSPSWCCSWACKQPPSKGFSLPYVQEVWGFTNWFKSGNWFRVCEFLLIFFPS